ncbi:MAG: protein translocase subunit SecF [Rhodobacteraceae bacterium]|jgi:preprotein translocase subunit SecF|nr:protein translocase subunit SecF [Paracoccaceae bacterium]MDG1299413.1 protein translocase subunit SecF [Paracoccaceae bacterium]MDG2374258.1 protein translocase subunit SecF [Paracoccaceae bacterium]|tara:strand:- start:366 stop:1334 length:969 start_codon:yes stop_codon:yes gene_type:complete
MRLKLIKGKTNYNFFGKWKLWLGISSTLIILSCVSLFFQGLNYGIDFRGGTTIRTESEITVNVSQYRQALDVLNLGDIVITEVFDPTFRENQNVTQIRIEAQDGDESITASTVKSVEVALSAVDPGIKFPLVESVGPKVSSELVKAAVWAVISAIGAVLFYIWLRFEWQFALGAVLALVHDIILTMGIFSQVQIKFDLAIIAALLTIVGYSLNDTVVVFDRVRENLRKYKKKNLSEVLNMSINETLARTLMTSVTTLLALISLYVLGGDVIKGFVFAMIWGVLVGTYSSIFIAGTALLYLGVKRDWSKSSANKGNKFGNIDA